MKKASIKFMTVIFAAAICLAAAGCSENAGFPVLNNNSKETERLSEEEAKAIALNHAGINENDVTFTAVKLDRENGKYEYELEFVTDAAEYAYNIGMDGEILSYSSKLFSTTAANFPDNSQQTTSDNKEPTATDTAENTTTITSPETESNVSQNTQPPSYETSAPEVFSSENYVETTSNSGFVNPDGISDAISETEAKNIALNHAGLTEKQVIFTDTELDCDYDRVHGYNGYQHNPGCKYEIEFISGNTEYEYEISINGEIWEYHSENILH